MESVRTGKGREKRPIYFFARFHFTLRIPNSGCEKTKNKKGGANMFTGDYELVVVWDDGGKDVYRYSSREEVEKTGEGMEMANGNQIKWWCVRPVFAGR